MTSELENPHMKKLREDQIERVKDGSFIQNTRAVTDVLELAALKKYTVISPFAPIGEYVLHSQAIEIIAADRAEIERLKEQNDKFKWQVRDTCTRAEAAEAKLAVAIEAEIDAKQSRDDWKKLAKDLQAKCNRYEQTLRGIAELSATGMSYGDQVFAVTSSRAALNVEDSHDKG